MKFKTFFSLTIVILASFPGPYKVEGSRLDGLYCLFRRCKPTTTPQPLTSSTTMTILENVPVTVSTSTTPPAPAPPCDRSAYPPLKKGIKVELAGEEGKGGRRSKHVEIGTVVDDDLDGVFVIKWDKTNITEFKSYGANCVYDVRIYHDMTKPVPVRSPYAIADFKESDDPADVRFVRPGPKWNYTPKNLNEIGVVLSANTVSVEVLWPSSPGGKARYYNNTQGVLEEVIVDDLRDSGDF